MPIYVGGVVIGSVNLGNGKDGWHKEHIAPLRMFATLLGGVMLMFEHRDKYVCVCVGGGGVRYISRYSTPARPSSNAN